MQHNDDSLQLSLSLCSFMTRPGLLPIPGFEVLSSATLRDNHGVENFALDIEEGVAARDFGVQELEEEQNISHWQLIIVQKKTVVNVDRGVRCIPSWKLLAVTKEIFSSLKRWVACTEIMNCNMQRDGFFTHC
jgi:hypothetical protein